MWDWLGKDVVPPVLQLNRRSWRGCGQAVLELLLLLLTMTAELLLLLTTPTAAAVLLAMMP